jgi:ankyrin repeat protein
MHSSRRLVSATLFRLAPILLIALASSTLAFCGEIHEAAAQGKLDIVQSLIKEDPRLVFKKNRQGETPLFLAAEKGHKDVAEFLLANHARVDAHNDLGQMPLDFAGNKDVAELLLANHADVNAKDRYGATALDFAVSANRKDVVEFLLANHAEVNARAENGSTALHLAALNGNVDIIELLLANNANVNAKAENGWSPLHCALKRHHLEAAEALRKHGGLESGDTDNSVPHPLGEWH